MTTHAKKEHHAGDGHHHEGDKVARKVAHKVKTEAAPTAPAADTAPVKAADGSCGGPNGCGGAEAGDDSDDDEA